MKLRVIATLIVIFLLTIPHGGGDCQAQQGAKKTLHGASARTLPLMPPSSLDALYPPKSEQPIYLGKMIGLNRPLTAIIINVVENDQPNAVASFEEFKTQYRDVAALVPEWKEYYPMKPVEELGAALKSWDQGTSIASIQDVGKLCERCHLENMVPVQQKYHWRDFAEITLHDPMTEKGLSFSEFKHSMERNLTGIGINLEKGERQSVLKQYEGFRVRFEKFKEVCFNCHDSERKYYVDASVQAMVDSLGKVLNDATVDPKAVQALSMGIGRESCFKCHLVHVPAAMTKALWRREGK